MPKRRKHIYKKRRLPTSKNRRRGAFRRIRINARQQLSIIALLLVALSGAIMLSRCAVPLQQSVQADDRETVTLSTSTSTSGTAAYTFSLSTLEIPVVDDAQFLLHNPEGRYTFYYDTTYRQAAWVAYTLTRYDVQTKDAQRRNRFYSDATVKELGWAYSTDRDYAQSGYDRGHLLPSADRNNTQAENDATFCLSNISPQHPNLNRKVWNNLENQVRRIAERFDTVYIVTGSELKAGLPRIGANGVGVPEVYFKILLTKKDDEYISIAFLVPNHDTVSGPYWDYAVAVNEAEKLLGIDFFPNLPDHLEEDIESRLELEHWK